MMTQSELVTFIYDHIQATGLPPRTTEIASYFRIPTSHAEKELKSLKVGKTVLVRPSSGEVWMAGPFASAPTDYVVNGSAKWFANCAWDMLGIPMITNEPVRVETKCTHCDDALVFTAYPNRPPDIDNAVVHFLVPAKQWYDDIGFT